jgi:hypothetical protein
MFGINFRYPTEKCIFYRGKKLFGHYFYPWPQLSTISAGQINKPIVKRSKKAPFPSKKARRSVRRAESADDSTIISGGDVFLWVLSRQSCTP